jgi:hypothetical protein
MKYLRIKHLRNRIKKKMGSYGGFFLPELQEAPSVPFPEGDQIGRIFRITLDL